MVVFGSRKRWDRWHSPSPNWQEKNTTYIPLIVLAVWGVICAMVKSRYIGDGHPTFNRNPYNWHIKPYYWVDDHPLLYGNNGNLDP